jgi:G:T/U-mismatch repair DNA glycosylase
MTIERHPLQPFLPQGAKILFLGSFPPPRAKWSMEFFYPNWINDFWRIMGIIHKGDKNYFEVAGEKRFDKERIIQFATQKGLAFYDTAVRVNRLNDNASDDLLEVLEATDITLLLNALPTCRTLVTTGGKASTLVQQHFQLTEMPKVGAAIDIPLPDRFLRWWRMPSSSRAYPLNINKKADFYRKLWNDK